MDGLSKRRGTIDKIHGLLTQDWEDLDIIVRRQDLQRDGGYDEEIGKLQERAREDQVDLAAQ